MRYHPFGHLGLKVLSLALATVLWLTVAGEHVVERGLRVPLEFRNVPKALEIVGNTPDTVNVRVRGSSAVLSRLQQGEIVAVLDLANARAGSRIFTIRSDEVRAPFGVEVSQVVPATVPLQLENSMQRRVPVVPSVGGEPAPGFVVGSESAEPPTVDIVGPESHVRQISEAQTEPVDVTGARSRVRDVVNIGVADSSVRLVEPQSATVIVNVLPAPVEKQIDSVSVKPRNLGGRLQARISPAVVKVTLRGTRATLSALQDGVIQAFVDLAGLGAGQYNLRVQVDPAQDYGVTAIDPAVVSITIR
ncbi:MAG TPA: CdaR family protein [Vicinamibacterales bacterium]|jgi:YbbR domain-containing protein|nr:CdaR family protein [Vicinamibacterales bacterium]